MEEIRISLDESSFTTLCKFGFLRANGEELPISKQNIKDLAIGKIIEINSWKGTYKVALRDIGSEVIREIVKRSPIHSDLYYEL